MTALIGTGSGLPLSSSIRLPTDKPRAATIIDFNGDGLIDIGIASQATPGVIILRNTGAGYSAIPASSSFPQSVPANGLGIAGGDFTGDGIPDLAFLSGDSVITLYQGSASGAFTVRDSFSVSPEIEALHLADFDRDGLVDLAALYRESNSIEVFRATEAGRFVVRSEAPALLPMSEAVNSPDAMVPRALTGPPATTDLVGLNAAARTVRRAAQTTPGAFTVSTAAGPLTDLPRELALADMTGDGIDDALVGLKLSGKGANLRSPLVVLPGMGSGSFGAAASGAATCGDGVIEGGELCDDGNAKARDGCGKTCVPEIAREVVALGTADFNGDDAADVAVVDRRGKLLVLLGDNAGRFIGIRQLESVKRGGVINIADFNGDGAPDIAIVPKSSRNGAILLLINSGSANFTPVPVPASVKVIGPLLAADFDANGTVDLAAGLKGGIAIFANDGSGPKRVAELLTTAKGIQSLGAADLNGSGRLDLVASFIDKKATFVHWFAGLGGAQFEGARAIQGSSALLTPTILDLNGDHFYDLVSCGASGGGCAALFGDGRGAFGAAAVTIDASIGPEVRGAGAADFDHDGHVDLVGVSKTLNRAVIVFGGVDGSSTGRLELPTGGVGPTSLAVADFNNDGWDDFVVVNEDSQDRSLFIHHPTNKREFFPPAVERLPDPNGVGAVGLTLGDINGDGKIDMAITQSGAAAVTPIFNTSPGPFVAGSVLATGADPRGVALGNLNGDETLDIVTANRAANTVSVLLSQPAGGYARTDVASNGLQPSAVAVLDLDNDGLDDLVITNEKITPLEKLGNLVVLLNDGTGAFPAVSSTHVRGRLTPRNACVGDFDGDTLPDVAVASFDSSDIMVLHGNGGGGFRTDETTFAVGKHVSEIDCHDADGDGRPDIAFTRHDGGDVGVVLTGVDD
jgi:cysteine-rich repeat protein